MKKKFILTAILLSAGLYSCTNVTIADFTPYDIGNIMNYLLFSAEEEQPRELAVPVMTDLEMQEIYEEPVTADITAPPLITDAPPPQNITEPPPAAPAPPIATETVQAYIPSSAEERDDGRHAVVRTDSVFEDAPQIFSRVRFPENLRMTDTLKQAIRNLEPLSVKNFDGINFYIATTEPMLFTPQLGGGDLSDLRNYRSQLVQTACNVRLAVTQAPEDMLPDIEARVNAGNYVTDILCVPLEIQARLAEKGLLMNLRKIPFINLGADYYNKSAIEAASINNNAYAIVSDMLFNPNDIYAMFYNKDLIRRYDMDNPMDLYINNNWTYDNMLALSKSLNPDLNNIYALGTDSESSDIINGLFIASGNDYFTGVHVSGYPILNFNNNVTRSLIDALSNIFSQPEINFLESDEPRSREIFTGGNMLFTISKLDIIRSIAEIDFDWGILPAPTLGGTEIKSFVSKDSLGISILKGTPNTEISGLLTEALSVSSHKIFQETYIREQLMYTLRDVESVRVLNDILNNVTYNQYNIYGAIESVYGATAGALRYAANSRGTLENLYETGRNSLYGFLYASPSFNKIN